MVTRTGVRLLYQPRNVKDADKYQKLEEARKALVLVSERTEPGCCLDFRLTDPIVLSHLVCGNLQHFWKLILCIFEKKKLLYQFFLLLKSDVTFPDVFC